MPHLFRACQLFQPTQLKYNKEIITSVCMYRIHANAYNCRYWIICINQANSYFELQGEKSNFIVAVAGIDFTRLIHERFTNLSRNYVSQLTWPYYIILNKMKIEFNNLYTHFIFSTLHRLPVIVEKNRERIEKYIAGVVNNNDSRLMPYMPILNMFIFWHPVLQNYQKKPLLQLLLKVLKSSLTKINSVTFHFYGRNLLRPFQLQNPQLIKYVNTFLINPNITGK